MAVFQRVQAGNLLVPLLEGFISPLQDVGEAVEYRGASGVDVQRINIRAPQSQLVAHLFLNDRAESIAARDYLAACAWQFGTITDDDGGQFEVLFYGPITPRITRGNYGWDGKQYPYRIQCPITVEVQSEI